VFQAEKYAARNLHKGDCKNSHKLHVFGPQDLPQFLWQDRHLAIMIFIFVNFVRSKSHLLLCLELNFKTLNFILQYYFSRSNIIYLLSNQITSIILQYQY